MTERSKTKGKCNYCAGENLNRGLEVADDVDDEGIKKDELGQCCVCLKHCSGEKTTAIQINKLIANNYICTECEIELSRFLLDKRSWI